MKFLVPNYICLQNPWLGGYRPQIPVLSLLCPHLNLLTPPPNKIPGYATGSRWSVRVRKFLRWTKTINLLYLWRRTCVMERIVAVTFVHVPSITSVVQKNLRNNGKLQDDGVSGVWHAVRAHWHRASEIPRLPDVSRRRLVGTYRRV